MLKSICPNEASELQNCLGFIPSENKEKIPQKCISSFNNFDICLKKRTDEVAKFANTMQRATSV